MLHIFILLLLSTSEVSAFVARSSERGTAAKRQLLPDERSSVPPPKQRVITPNDIASLFGGSSSKSRFVEEDDYDFEDEDEASETEEAVDNVAKTPVQDANPAVMAELERLETISFSRSTGRPSTPSAPRRERSVPDLDYLDLDSELSDQKLENARSSLSLLDEDELSSAIDAPRVFMYDPAESVRMYDPMKFGAYARWKQAADKMEKLNKKNAKKKRKEGLSPDSFYNAIKNLGSGPKGKDVPTGVGVADPPKGKSPITPNKAPVKKNKKRTITPDEIDSLFQSKKRSESEEVSVRARSDDSSAVDEGAFNPLLRDDEPLPQWIIDAEKAAKYERRMRGKKQKKLTDDWRFWAAIIAAAGFGAAFFSVYQQTGGFGGGMPSIGGFDPNNLDGAGQEFVI